MTAATHPAPTADVEERCPHCGAIEGERCVTAGGELRQHAHVARWEARRRAYLNPRRYVLNPDQPEHGLKAGDVLVCQPYRLDPVKAAVLYRESDGHKPRCNVYWRLVTPILGTAGKVTT